MIDPELLLAQVHDDYKPLARVQRAHQDDLLAKANVVGVGIGTRRVGGEDTGELCLTVCVSAKLPPELLADEDIIPRMLDDVPVDVFEIGFPTVSVGLLDQRRRPAFGGLSVGHGSPRAGSGTLGTGCYANTFNPGIPNKYFLLSCNHVIALSNGAAIGSPIVQPGVSDGGTAPADTIGTLAGFVPIQFLTPTSKPLNFADVAIAEVALANVEREIYWIGHPKRRYIPAVKLGEIVQKTGKTTGFTTGNVLVQSFTGDIGGFPGGQVARFGLLFLTSPIGAAGDSGSIVCDLDDRAVGMFMASTGAGFGLVESLLVVEGYMGVMISPHPPL